jgi:hypothetical protein
VSYTGGGLDRHDAGGTVRADILKLRPGDSAISCTGSHRNGHFLVGRTRVKNQRDLIHCFDLETKRTKESSGLILQKWAGLAPRAGPRIRLTRSTSGYACESCPYLLIKSPHTHSFFFGY